MQETEQPRTGGRPALEVDRSALERLQVSLRGPLIRPADPEYVLAVDLVLSDGSFVTASAEEHPDLFWAVRGGGGNFGVAPSTGATHHTAFSYRDALWSEVIVGVDPDPAKADTISTWTKAYWDALHPYSAGGAYVNFMMDEGQERVRATYRDNYQRLVEVKQRYDPDNLFHVNQNIRPGH